MMHHFEEPEFRYFHLASFDIPYPEKIGPGFVDLYEIEMSLISDYSSHFLPYLSRDEYTRAEHMVSPDSRVFAFCSYGLRRVILSRYQDINPGSIYFRENAYGKPFIDNPNPRMIFFNVSHSKSRLIIGISMNRDIGVDNQGIDASVPIRRIAERVFSKKDLKSIVLPDKEDSIGDFYRIWTAREAYSKAVGMGFSLPDTDVPDFSDLKSRAVMYRRDRTWFLSRPAEWAEFDCCVIVSDLSIDSR
jgi:4'-phosphopantetheinyl transferase